MKIYTSQKNIKTKRVTNKGFTIIETLVAITILMISIAGPLTIAEKGLSAAVNTRDQITASYLGQDLMEYIKNVRDADLLNGNNIFSTHLATCVGPTSYCNIDTVVDVPTSPSMIPCASTDCYMYLDSNGFYRSTSNGGANTKTQFSRYANIQVIDVATSKYLLTVFVSWKAGTVSNQIVLKDVLTNAMR